MRVCSAARHSRRADSSRSSSHDPARMSHSSSAPGFCRRPRVKTPACRAVLWCVVLCCPLCSGYLNTNVWEYKENIAAMVDKLKAKGVENIIVLVPPPVRGSTAQSLAEVVSMLGPVHVEHCIWDHWGGCCVLRHAVARRGLCSGCFVPWISPPNHWLRLCVCCMFVFLLLLLLCRMLPGMGMAS